MKKLSFQWRITLMTALLIAGACICLNLLLDRSGATGMDDLGGFVLKYQTENAEVLTIEIPPEEMNGFLKQFSQEICDAKIVFERVGWCLTAAVTLLSAAIAYFVSGRALQPLRQFTAQAEKINQESLERVRLDESAIQEFRQLSHAVNGMLDRLAHSFDLQRQFAGNAAHELRTPLALMQTKLELFCEEHADADAGTMQMAAFQMEQLDRLSALVRTLLSMSNLQSVSRTDEIPLAPLAEEILTDLAPLAQEKQVTLRQDCEEVSMVGSDALIYRLLFNLIENAIKYNKPGGTVFVSVKQADENVILEVADTGSGIPEDCMEHIFEPFFRVDKSRSRQMGGVGLGLALVREIALLHGGSVRAEVRAEGGTAFRVVLPRQQA